MKNGSGALRAMKKRLRRKDRKEEKIMMKDE